MNWERTIERYPDVWQDSGTTPDPFDSLRKQIMKPVMGPQEPRLHARLEYNTHRSFEVTDGPRAGWVKCSVTINIVCPQTERHIDMAGEVAFVKAIELVNDGLSHMVGGQQG